MPVAGTCIDTELTLPSAAKDRFELVGRPKGVIALSDDELESVATEEWEALSSWSSRLRHQARVWGENCDHDGREKCALVHVLRFHVEFPCHR